MHAATVAKDQEVFAIAIHSARVSQLPLRLRELIDRDLQSGERIVWLAQPIPGRCVLKWALVVIAGLVGAAVGRFFLTDNTIRWDLMGIGLPVAGIGLIGALYAWRRALNTAYLVTDRRAVMSPAPSEARPCGRLSRRP